MGFCIRSFLLLLGGAAAVVRLGAAEVFPINTTWSYLKGTVEASNPIGAWRQVGFNDSTWLSGNAPFFYENDTGYSGNTTLTDMFGGYTSIYMRKVFSVINPGDVTQLQLNIQSDDGCIVWINGVEVGRVNMSAGDKLHGDVSNAAAGEPNVATLTVNDPPMLVAGNNVVAVHAFNSSLGSSGDFLISVSMNSTLDDSAPILVEIVPPPSASVRTLAQIEVFFDDNVTGVDAADLRINGSGATGLTVYSPRNYLFTFPQPNPGAVNVSWATGHGIADTASTPHPFGGGSWIYTLDPTAPESTVILSEFMADNDDIIDDEDGNSSDWIEVLNLGPVAVNLSGWFLTDDPEDLTKWRFPAQSLAVNGYLLVWASEKNRTVVGSPLHTNFKLDPDGDYLALVNAQTNVVSAFAPLYPAQRTDVSYGRDRANPTVTGFFVTPTPGAPNTTSGAGFAPDPVFSVEGGVYDAASLSLVLSAPSGVVRYTLDGSVPTASSTAYSAPINLTSSTVVNARVFETGLLPSRIVVNTYNFVGTGLTGFSSNLPLMIVNTSGQGIPQDTRIKATVTVIDTFRGRSTVTTRPEFQGLCLIEGRGQTSAGFPKKPYNLEINDAFGNDLEAGFLGLPPESDWVLNNPYSDKCLMNNFLAFELHEMMGHYAVRRRFVELFVDSSGGRLNYPGDYAGIYLLQEKIKIDNNRVDYERLDPTINAEPDISGGYIVKKDKSSPGDVTFSTAGGGGFTGQGLRFHEPKPDEITSAQQNWIRNYLNQFEQALYATDWLIRTGPNHYSNFIEPDSFVDYHWIVEFSKQIDGYRLSNYFGKDRGGKLKMEPIWDWNLSFGNANYLQGDITSGWYYSQIGENDHIWLRRLINGTTSGTGTSGDPDFNQKITDRWSVLRTNVMAISRVLGRVDAIAQDLNEAQVREFSKWPRLGTAVWPNPGFYVTPTTYQGIIDAMKNWLQNRFNWIDSQFLRAPTLSLPEGPVSVGSSLAMSAPSGTIVYTLNGLDPRLPGGGLRAGALTYSGSIAINANVRIVARTRNGATWSGPAAATYVTSVPPLTITEIMSHPQAPPAGSLYLDEDFEFLELKNTGASLINLAGMKFTNGIEFAFSGGSLAVGQRALLVKNPAAFVSRYGAGPVITGTYLGSLDNNGERLTLVGPMLEVVQNFRYEGSWQPITDGVGFSLVPEREDTPGQDWNNPINWRPAGVLGGSPGAADPGATVVLPVFVNEALTHTDPPLEDGIELYNPNASPVNIGGWFLTDDRLQPKKFRIPNNITIDAHAFAVFTETQFNAATPGNIPFQLGSTGDEIYLYAASTSGALLGYVHGFDFGAARNGISFGRHVTSTGADHFVAQLPNSMGTANATPKVGPIVINEVMYHPPDVFANGRYWNNPEDEFIELHNITDSPAPLFDPLVPANRWRLRDAVSFEFAASETLPARGFLVVVGFDPARNPAQLAAFRARYGITTGVRVVGPFQRSLDNDTDSVELVMPDTPNPPPAPQPYVLVDKVRYADLPPWPGDADGLGASLQRINASAYGNDPANWFTAGYSPGFANTINLPPQVQLLSPLNGAVVQFPAPVSFQASATDPDGSIFGVDFFAGSLLVGQDTTSPYAFTWNDPPSGLYQMYAVARDTRGGFATSAVASVTVIAPTTTPVTFIPVNASWRYLDTGVDQGTAWRGVSFSDTSWLSGPGQFGYGDGDEATLIRFGTDANKYPTTYFRHTFNLLDASAVTELTLKVLRDDGAVAYVNGTEVFRNNMPAGTIAYSTYASGTTPDESTYFPATVDPALLRDGPNVLAIEVHQANATSTDLSFDAELIGATLVFDLPTITSHPVSVAAVVGQRVKLVVNATSDIPLSYQWQKDGVDLPGRTTPTLLIDPVAVADAGSYRARVSNAFGSVFSNPANLSVAVQDTDGDGMPDAWETQYGLNPNSAADALLDLDSDGMSNRDEYTAGTHPGDSDSYLKVESIASQPMVLLVFQAKADKSYTVQWTDRVPGGTWARLTNLAPRATDYMATVTDPSAQVRRYYRLVTPQEQ